MEALRNIKFTKEHAFFLGLLGFYGLVLGKRQFIGGICEISKDLTGKVVIITGANTGIGKETARELAKLNATVVIASRDDKKSLPVVEELRVETKNPNIEFMRLDLADLKSIKQFSEEFKAKYKRLDILVNNAGVMAYNERTLTKDGFEAQFGVNHMGHFYLTMLLIDILKATGSSRVITLSSDSHLEGKMDFKDLNAKEGYMPWKAYAQSKLANVLFTRELQRRMDLEGADVKAVAVHPGLVRTEITRYAEEKIGFKIFLTVVKPLLLYTAKNANQGAQTTLHCALEDFKELKGGEYYEECKVGVVSKQVTEANGKLLFKMSEEYLAGKI